jgi:hypothetical protein
MGLGEVVSDEIRGHPATEGLFAKTLWALASARFAEFEKLIPKKNKKA